MRAKKACMLCCNNINQCFMDQWATTSAEKRLAKFDTVVCPSTPTEFCKAPEAMNACLLQGARKGPVDLLLQQRANS
jgi:hypothetical protein